MYIKQEQNGMKQKILSMEKSFWNLNMLTKT
jgi:hypothetical protein